MLGVAASRSVAVEQMVLLQSSTLAWIVGFRTELARQAGEDLEGRTVLVGKLPLTDHMGSLDSGQRRYSRMERLEAHHRARDALDEAMILLEDVVEIFHLPDPDRRAVAGELQDDIDRL